MSFMVIRKYLKRKRWYEPQRGPRPDEGYIGLQNHDGRSTVLFREVSVRPTFKLKYSDSLQ